MRRGAPLAGTLYWVLAAPSYGDFDGFTIYLSGPRRGQAAEALEAHAAYVAALNAEAEEAVAVAICGAGSSGVLADGPPGVVASTSDCLVASPVPNPLLVQQRQQVPLPPLPAPPPLHPHTTCTRFICPCCFIS